MSGDGHLREGTASASTDCTSSGESENVASTELVCVWQEYAGSARLDVRCGRLLHRLCQDVH